MMVGIIIIIAVVLFAVSQSVDMTETDLALDLIDCGVAPEDLDAEIEKIRRMQAEGKVVRRVK